MIKIEAGITIACPQSEVFEFLTEVENMPRWQGGVQESKSITPGPVRAGALFSQKARVGPWKLDIIGTVTDLKVNERFAFEVKSAGPLNCRVHFDLEPITGGTRVTVAGVAQVKGLWRLLRPLLARELRQETLSELAALKEVLEEAAPARASMAL